MSRAKKEPDADEMGGMSDMDADDMRKMMKGMKGRMVTSKKFMASVKKGSKKTKK